MSSDDDEVSSTPTFDCTECSSKYKSQHDLNHHISTNHKPRTHPCHQCSKAYSSALGLSQHVGRYHAPKNFFCDLCPKSFLENAGLLRHQKEHKNKPFQCNETGCNNRLFKTDQELQAHNQKLHQSKSGSTVHVGADPNAPDADAPFLCRTCLKWFKTQHTVDQHIKLSHESEKAECDVCQKQFANKKAMLEHKEVRHGPKKFACSKCAKQFATKLELNRHEPSCRSGGSQADVTSITGEAQASLPKTSVKQPTIQTPTKISEPFDEEEEEVESMISDTFRNLFGDDTQRRIKALLSSVRTVAARSMYTALPETPTPVQQIIMGRNLRRFEYTQFVEPLPALADPTKDPGPNLHNLLAQPARRKLFAKHSMDPKTTFAKWIHIKTFAGDKPSSLTDDQVVINVVELMLDGSSVHQYADTLRKLLERVPVMLKELPNNLKIWVQTAARRIIFGNDTMLKLRLQTPKLTSKRHRGEPMWRYTSSIAGYDASKHFAWKRNINVPVGAIDSTANIEIENAERYEWIGSSGTSDDMQTHKWTKEDFDHGFELAKLLSVRLLGFIGRYDDCLAEARKITIGFWPRGKKARGMEKDDLDANDADVDADAADDDESGPAEYAAGAPPWEGQALWMFSRKATYSVFDPSNWLERRMTGGTSHIIIQTIEPERLSLVANAMLTAMKVGHTEDEVWGIGAAIADLEAQRGTAPSYPICECTDTKHNDELHVCPECLRLRPHNSFDANSLVYFKICKDCNSEIELQNKQHPVDGGILGHSILRVLNTENSITKSKFTSAQIKAATNEIYASLKFMHLGKSEFKDGYAAQHVDSRAYRRASWDGARISPLTASIDAINPIVEGTDGLTHYHYKDRVVNNFAITSDALNRAVRHYPKVMLHAVLLFTESPQKGQKTYESAIGITRNCLINRYEYREFGNIQQTARIGKPVPKNMAAITASYTTAALLPRTISKEKVWRIHGRKQWGDLGQRALWRPEHFGWLMTQLTYVEIEVFADQVSRFRYLWMRSGADGQEVFFPFSQYSVVVELTWLDMWEMLSQKTLRNITECQRPHSLDQPPISYTVEELFLVVANLWLRMIKRDMDADMPPYDYGRDEAGLIPHPNINSLLCASLGHRWPGETQTLGLVGFDLRKKDKVGFEPDKCNFFWETQFCNFLKFKYNIKYLKSEVFNQLPLIRRGTLAGETRQLLPAADLNIALRDEAAFDLNSKILPLQDENLAQHDHSQIDEVADAITDLKKAKAQATDTDLFEDPFSDDDPDLWAAVAATVVAPEAPTWNAAPGRSLSNLSNTCYLSAPIHILANLSVFKAIILNQTEFRKTSGRRPELLRVLQDIDGKKHINYKEALVQTVKSLSKNGPRLTLAVTNRILTTSRMLKSAWKNENNDSAEYASFLIDTLDTVMDQSDPIPGADIVEKSDSGLRTIRSPHRPEELLNELHLVDVTNGNELPPLSSHAEQHWLAHLASGHDSLLTREACLQYVEIFQCSSPQCSSTMRQFKYASQIQLKFPHTTDNNDAISLDDLVEQSFNSSYSPAPKCEHVNQHPRSGDGEYSTSITRFTRAGRAFSVELNRTRLVDEVEAGIDIDREDRQLLQMKLAEEASRTPYRNRVTDYERVRIEAWANGGTKLASKPHLGALSPRHEILDHESLTREYEVHGIVAYNYNILHYTAFVLQNGKWIYYDDLAATPVYRDPWTNWPEGFIETILFYQAVAMPLEISDSTPTGRPLKVLGPDEVSVESSKFKSALPSGLHASFDQLLSSISRTAQEQAMAKDREIDRYKAMVDEALQDAKKQHKESIQYKTIATDALKECKSKDQEIGELKDVNSSLRAQLESLRAKPLPPPISSSTPTIDPPFRTSKSPSASSRKRRRSTMGRLKDLLGGSADDSSGGDRFEVKQKPTRRPSFDILKDTGKRLMGRRGRQREGTSSPDRSNIEQSTGSASTPTRRLTTSRVPSTPPRSTPSVNLPPPSSIRSRPHDPTITAIPGRTPTGRYSSAESSDENGAIESPTKAVIDRLSRQDRDKQLKAEREKYTAISRPDDEPTLSRTVLEAPAPSPGRTSAQAQPSQSLFRSETARRINRVTPGGSKTEETEKNNKRKNDKTE